MAERIDGRTLLRNFLITRKTRSRVIYRLWKEPSRTRSLIKVVYIIKGIPVGERPCVINSPQYLVTVLHGYNSRYTPRARRNAMELLDYSCVTRRLYSGAGSFLSLALLLFLFLLLYTSCPSTSVSRSVWVNLIHSISQNRRTKVTLVKTFESKPAILIDECYENCWNTTRWYLWRVYTWACRGKVGQSWAHYCFSETVFLK